MRGKVVTSKCPMCGNLVSWEGNVYRPFCSQRCQLVDLDGWFNEHYRVPQAEEDDLAESEPNGNHPMSENDTL